MNYNKAPFPWFADGTVTIDDAGAVWRHRSNGVAHAPRRIDASDCHKGYRNVVLPLNGKWQTFKAHRLVWVWHRGPLPEGAQINHRNGIKDDNRISNLEVVTQSENMLHSYANGRSLPYSRTPTASDRQTEMKRRRAEGALFREIADEFGISVSHAHRLVGTEVER